MDTQWDCEKSGRFRYFLFAAIQQLTLMCNTEFKLELALARVYMRAVFQRV